MKISKGCVSLEPGDRVVKNPVVKRSPREVSIGTYFIPATVTIQGGGKSYLYLHSDGKWRTHCGAKGYFAERNEAQETLARFPLRP